LSTSDRLESDVPGEVEEELATDVDATDDPTHGAREEGCHLNAHQDTLHVTYGDNVSCGRRRSLDIDPSRGAPGEPIHIIGRIRAVRPATRIIAHGDSGFRRDDI